MIVEVRGTGVHNKGAELMLCAIIQRFAQPDGAVRFAVEPTFGPYRTRAKYGLLTKLPRPRFGRSLVARLTMSPEFRRTYGIVHDNEVNAVLDASGFAFGDAWGPGPSVWLAYESRRWKKRGSRAILLPQAFGPFVNDHVRSAFRRALDEVPLIFARDKTSFDYIQNLGGPFPHVKQAPDFTNVVKGVCPDNVKLPKRFACIVPNIRMLDRTSNKEGESYSSFLATCITELHRHSITPLVLFHDAKNDAQVAAHLQRRIDCKLPIIRDEDPIHLKGILGRAMLVVGSRFHALVGALSQGVPAIATSWSHKYEMLFRDYGCQRFVMAPTASNHEIANVVEHMCSDDGQSELRTALRLRATLVRAQVEDMFVQVARTISLRS